MISILTLSTKSNIKIFKKKLEVSVSKVIFYIVSIDVWGTYNTFVENRLCYIINSSLVSVFLKYTVCYVFDHDFDLFCLFKQKISL